MTVAAVLTADLLVKGVVSGLVIALIGMGIVLVHRSSRVVNFSAAHLGVPPGILFAVMAGAQGWPYGVALVLALALGTASGAVVELTVVRRLFHAPRVILLVATIGVAQLALAISTTLPDFRQGALQRNFPLPFQGTWTPWSDVTLGAAQLLIILTVPVVTAALWWLLSHTAFGEAVRASASNPDLARLTGISPKLVSTAVWSIAGFLSTLAILLAASNQGAIRFEAVGPDLLLRGMAAALVGRLVSFPRAVAGALAIGVGERLVTYHYPLEPGLSQFLLFVVVVGLVAWVARRGDAAGESIQWAPRPHPVPEHLVQVWWVRNLSRIAAALALVTAVVAPIVWDLSSRHQIWTTTLGFALCALSVVVLTGWAGQLSLGQMGFAGIAGLTAAAFARGLTLDVGWRDTRLDVSLDAVAFPWTALIGALVACVLAVVIGLGALRARGLLLAASTLAFAIACQNYVFSRPVFTAGRSTVQVPRAVVGPFDLTYRNRGYYFVLAVLIVALVVVGHLRRSGIGRRIVGVRENEDAAAAMSVSPARTKLLAFALAGFLAGLGGALLAAVPTTFGPAQRFYLVTDSIAVVSMVVIGGLGSLGGAVAGALWVVGLPSFFPGNDFVPLFASSIGLLIVLMYLPGGFAQAGYWVRDRVVAIAARRVRAEPAPRAETSALELGTVAARVPLTTNVDGSALAVRGLTVAYGGILAVDHVDLHARPGEVVGLIGTNGAGKSTLLNALGGFVRSSGDVELLGQDVTRARAHARTQLGLGRTFQAATLYPALTVRDCVLLALEARRRTGFWSTVARLPAARAAERARRAEAAELIAFLGLGRYADRYVAELSTGTRRIVELAAVLAVGPRVICLDEPTAGVAQREAEAFGPLITEVRRELDATLLIVEHDLPLVLSISDRLYCLEAGRVIAEGPPDRVRDDPKVVASYLGTAERAIARSGAID